MAGVDEQVLTHTLFFRYQHCISRRYTLQFGLFREPQHTYTPSLPFVIACCISTGASYTHTFLTLLANCDLTLHVG